MEIEFNFILVAEEIDKIKSYDRCGYLSIIYQKYADRVNILTCIIKDAQILFHCFIYACDIGKLM